MAIKNDPFAIGIHDQEDRSIKKKIGVILFALLAATVVFLLTYNVLTSEQQFAPGQESVQQTLAYIDTSIEFYYYA